MRGLHSAGERISLAVDDYLGRLECCQMTDEELVRLASRVEVITAFRQGILGRNTLVVSDGNTSCNKTYR